MATYEVKRHKGGLVVAFDTQEEAANYIQSKNDPTLYVDVGDAPTPVIEPNDYIAKSKHEGKWVHTPFKELFLKLRVLHYIFITIFTLNLAISLASGTFISGGYLLGLTEFTLAYLSVIGILMFMQRSQYILTEKGQISYEEAKLIRTQKAEINNRKIQAVFNGIVLFVLALIGLAILIWIISGIPAIPLAIIVGAMIIAAALQNNKR